VGRLAFKAREGRQTALSGFDSHSLPPVATARREAPAPSLEQVQHVIRTMPARTIIEERNRALVAFILLTGARDGAVASLKLKHLDLAAGCVVQDAREVATKFGKTFTTWFFPVGQEAREIVEGWAERLRSDLLWSPDDPLFPATQVGSGEGRAFQAVGLARRHWSSADPIRDIFREGFQAAGLPYFAPHRLRSTLAQLGERRCKSPEQFKAWSQNLGHSGVLTTFTSYGTVPDTRQADIIRALGHGETSRDDALTQIAKLAENLLGAA
jgi:integrase/recombinase XerD